MYSKTNAQIVSVVAAVSIATFWICGGIDGKHAKRLMNDTSLGELFKYTSDLISTIFLIILICQLYDCGNDVQWYFVQTGQLVLFYKHYSAFMREAGLRYLLIGPGELLTWAMGLLCIRAIFGLGWLSFVYDLTWGYASRMIVDYWQLPADGYLATMSPSRATFLTTYFFVLFQVAVTRKPQHRWTRNCLFLILLTRGISGWLRITLLTGHSSENMTVHRDTISDALFLSLVTSDTIVAKMASRELHPWVVLMSATVVMPHLHFLMFFFAACYYIAVFGTLMAHMNLPLLQVIKNVYCDGIYDLCHIGHKNLFRSALKNGNRLFVGVVGDTDANNYKRPPVMSASERENEVSSCKCVTKVIQNAPCFGLTEEFIKRHRIHVVCCGQEYIDRFPDPDNDPYYKVPRKMGIAKPLPRTDGLSTSDLIKRIQNMGADVKKSPT
jgi:choline-phosphate cytidylyltransferase